MTSWRKDLDRELRYHLDRRVADLMRSGLREREAQRQAKLELGGLAQVQEEVRDVWLTRWLRDFAYDLRFSARTILRSRSFTATTVLSLALGIGATTAIYSLVDQVILHPLPVREPERLVLVDWKGDQVANGFGSRNLMSYPICRDLQLQADFSYRGLREESEQAYFPLIEGSDAAGTFYVKVRGTPEQAAQSIRSIVRSADSTLPLTYLRTMDEQVDRSLNTERILATLSAGFGALALMLSLVGLYGVMSFVVTQRTREIGIRMALGAGSSAAVWLVLRDAMVMIAAGIAVALPCVGVLGRLVESQLFGVTASDPVTITGTTLLLAAAALAAALIPAYRAATVNPTDALRAE